MRPLIIALLVIGNMTLNSFGGEAALPSSPPQLNNDAKYQAALEELLANKPAQSASQRETFLYLLKLSSAYSNMRQYAAAEKTQRILLSSYPDMTFLHSNLSVYLGKQGKYEEAKAAAEKALSLDPDYIHAKWVLPSWQWNLGDHETALKNFNAIPVPVPEDKGLLSLYYGCMACFYADVGDPKKVEFAITKSLELDDSPEGRAFFERDVVFDKFRDRKWFISLVGKTLSEHQEEVTDSQ